MIPNRLVNLRCYLAKQELERVKLTLVSCKSFPDYNPITIDEKFIKQGAD